MRAGFDAVLVLAFLASANGQTTPGRQVHISGQATDTCGLPLVNAQVTIKPPATGEIVARARVGHDGEFDTPAIPPGIYSLQIEESGAAESFSQPVDASKGNVDLLVVATTKLVICPVTQPPVRVQRSQAPQALDAPATGFPLPKTGYPVVTVCEALTSPATYNGKSIIIVGKQVATDEGAWLVEDCELRIERKPGGIWRPGISLSYVLSRVDPPPVLPKGFKWDLPFLQTKLAQVRQSTKLDVLPQYNYSDKWVAAFGRFEVMMPLETAEGFGHLNSSPAQLIWKDGFLELKPK